MAFDLDTYSRIAGRLDVSDLDLDGGFRAQPLDDDALRCLRYMHDIESHTVCYLRDILVTRAHRDPNLTTFLTLWNFEEHWHGDAIGAVLAAHDRDHGRPRVAATRGETGFRERLRPLAFMAASGLLPDITAIQMTWGAINEWTTQAGYARLGRRAGHPLLQELLGRIMRQEGRHVDFYASQASTRLASDRRAQRLTRFALTRYWKPVGSDVMPQAEVRFMVNHLFGDDGGAAVVERLDRNIHRLPGLDGLYLLRSAAQRRAA